eukprot:GHRR01020484.1.p1 GENE.GHRR01020484.1~~GHRR01020484.1.p1  ORF type:complete len:134 (-),score=14.28 GHRR01020484.1:47-448(-)
MQGAQLHCQPTSPDTWAQQYTGSIVRPDCWHCGCCTAQTTMGRCPDEATSGLFNKLSFGWMNNVVRKAKRGDVDVHELPLPTDQTAEVAYGAFQASWDDAVKSGQPSLRKVLWRTFGKDLMLAGLFKLVWSVW